MNQDDSKKPKPFSWFDDVHEIDETQHSFPYELGRSKNCPVVDSYAASKEAQQCIHDWQVYNGFHFSDLYCIKCGQTRPLDPSK